ncbi:molybdate ABC transporter substrate-binding protein [Pacificibacter maritimus]|nr:molybdate ABC transporter substrate-binding protein [Pacificibacter maritimus]
MINLKFFQTLRQFSLAAAGALTVFAANPIAASADAITVFAAASLKEALDEVKEIYEAQSPHSITLSYGGSSTLARQITQGAPAHVFISASPQWMDVLETQDLVQHDTRFDLVTNRLVMVAPSISAAPVDITQPAAFQSRLGDGLISMGFVDAVPAGIYGKSALVNLGIWDQIKGRVVQGNSVRAALALVARAEVPFGVVYETDALSEPRVAIVAVFPNDTHAPILYPAALIAPAPEGAGDFAAFLASQAAMSIFAAHGFGQVISEQAIP